LVENPCRIERASRAPGLLDHPSHRMNTSFGERTEASSTQRSVLPENGDPYRSSESMKVPKTGYELRERLVKHNEMSVSGN
jgi:hypothetical protein